MALPLGPYIALLQILRPSWLRPNVFHLWLQGGSPAASPPSSLRLSFDMQGMNMGVTRLTAHPVGRGLYLASGSRFSMGGTWRVFLTAGKARAAAILFVNQ